SVQRQCGAQRALAGTGLARQNQRPAVALEHGGVDRDPAVRLIADAPVQAPLEGRAGKVARQREERPLAVDDEIGLRTYPLAKAPAGDHRDVEVTSATVGQ